MYLGKGYQMVGGTKYSLIFLLIFVFFPVFPALPTPVEVIFFPQGAWVKEVTKVRGERAGGIQSAVLHLPPQAEPQSLRLALREVTRGRLLDFTIRETGLPLDEKAKYLRQKIEEGKKNRANLLAQLRGVEGQILFWQTQAKGKAKNTMEALNTSQTIGRNLKKLTLEKLSLEVEQGKLEASLGELEREYEAYLKKRAKGWEVTIYWEGKGAGEAEIVYSYLLKEASWSSLFRLEALPQEGAIAFAWEVEVFQPTGENWKNVSILLSDTPFNLALLPPPLSASHPKTSDPTKTAKMWEVGKGDIPYGAKARFILSEERWPTEFSYMARPSSTAEVFLRGTAKTPAIEKLTPGRALFLVNGTVMGKSDIVTMNKQEPFYFGTEPAIKVTTTLLSKEAGQIKRLIKILNAKDRRVVVDVEEPMFAKSPKDSFFAEPPPSYLGKETVFWRLMLEPGEEKIISIETLPAPGQR